LKRWFYLLSQKINAFLHIVLGAFYAQMDFGHLIYRPKGFVKEFFEKYGKGV